jgi:hypothetical protein
MIPPGGDALIHAAAEMIVVRLERAEAQCKRGYIPRTFAQLSREEQAFWLLTLRDVIEMTVAATLTDIAQAVAGYDPIMGAAYQRTIHRYSLQELDHPLHQE